MTESKPPTIFDPLLVASAARRAAQRTAHPFLMMQAIEGIEHRLGVVTRHLSRGLVVGSPHTVLDKYADNWTEAEFAVDERLKFAPPADFDVAVSLLSLHRLNDLPGAMIQIRKALKPDGLFIAALFGGDSLCEFRESLAAGELMTLGGTSPHFLPTTDVRDLGGLLQRTGFSLPVADVERTVVRYRDLFALIGDLRDLGETNILRTRSRKGVSRRTLAATIDHYVATHADQDGRLRATFDIIYLTGWSPHESQPRPLRPGTAEARLADVLGTKEKKV